jgi:hypothetical protein
VFYDGIPDLRFPWIPIPNVEEWQSVPDGAIVVIDEAQRVFPPRAVGAPVPAKVRAFETHRHRGLDIYLVTQDAMLIDAHVRRLAGEHLHFRRAFGSRRVARLRWPEVKDPRDKGDVRQAEKAMVELRRDLFDKYRSATLHTVKRRIPWPLLSVPVVLLAMGAAGYFGWTTLQGFKDEKPKPTASKPSNSGSGLIPVAASAPGLALTPASVGVWVASYQPRVTGLMFTAPVYDEITKPVRAPYPAMCIANDARCRCYTDAGTRYDAPQDLCRQLAERGFYRVWDQPGPFSAEQSGSDLRKPTPGAAVTKPPEGVGPPAGPITAPAEVLARVPEYRPTWETPKLHNRTFLDDQRINDGPPPSGPRVR